MKKLITTISILFLSICVQSQEDSIVYIPDNYRWVLPGTDSCYWQKVSDTVFVRWAVIADSTTGYLKKIGPCWIVQTYERYRCRGGRPMLMDWNYMDYQDRNHVDYISGKEVDIIMRRELMRKPSFTE